MENSIKMLIIIVTGLVMTGLAGFLFNEQRLNFENQKQPNNNQVNDKSVSIILDPLTIEAMKKRNYPGSEITIKETLTSGSNYNQYLASYQSDGLKIYALLTIPNGQKPKNGWPAIILNHGYIPPETYRTTEKYLAYVDAFARNGYVVFKPDYRGNGSSEGQTQGSYYSPGYTVDVLNALSSIKQYSEVDAQKLGMWGHSMGGNITLRSLVVSKDLKAAVIWAGVVGTYDDLMNNWQKKVSYQPPPPELANRNSRKSDLISKYGSPAQNPEFWNSIDPNFNLQYVSVPIQLHVGLADEEVPWQFSQGLENRLKTAGKSAEFYTYPEADHNISGASFSVAINRSVEFFNKYLKK